MGSRRLTGGEPHTPPGRSSVARSAAHESPATDARALIPRQGIGSTEAAKLLTAPPVQETTHRPSGDEGADPRLVGQLDKAFGQSFVVVDATQGVIEHVTPDWPRVDVFCWLSLCEQVARGGRAEVIDEHAPLFLLAVPLETRDAGPRRVAVAALLSEPDPSREDLESAARVFGVDPDRLAGWSVGRRHWPPHAALALAQSLVENHTALDAANSAKHQLSDVSSQLLATFEELNLLHRLTESLSLGRSGAELGRQAVRWLADVTPSESLVAILPDKESGSLVLTGGDPPLEREELEEFFERLGPQATERTLVLNRDRTGSPTWAYPGVREVVTAPIVSNEQRIGWLAAINHRQPKGSTERGFGSVEASLLSSVATILGVHIGNRRLYEERSELITSAVGALTSAIDAKDPYTCGHSDRVARIAVRLAKQLGLGGQDLNTIYMGGLLHDVGKIGVDDTVLRKPDRLTDEEFEQIKLHPELGERILRDVKQLQHVLPIVRHHHESWDGSGYPDGLAGENCPQLARIVAVADSIDAMGSDRPYRKGMPVERVEAILREGAGKQWDADVIDAYFASADDVREISQVERDPLALNVGEWNRDRLEPSPTAG